MRDVTRQRLDRAIRMRRLKFVAAGAGVLALVGAVLWFTGLDASVENHPVSGVVEKVGPLNGLNTQAVETGLDVNVKLDDGRQARVMALKVHEPKVGQRVQIVEHVHGSGRTTFSWK